MIARKINSFVKAFLLYKVFRHWVILNFISRNIRCHILRYCGANIGKNVYFSNGIYIDSNAEYLYIEDDVLVSPNVMLLFHKRDLTNYKQNVKCNTLPHIKSRVTIKKGAFIGMGAIIMPGVTVGVGAGVGAGALVTKDVPDWTIVGGNPAKILKIISKQNET